MTASPRLMPSAGSPCVTAAPAGRPVAGLEEFEHRFETVNGLRLHYVTGGNPDGAAIVLLAGFPESWFAWRKVMRPLAATYRIVALDLPGQGDSDRPLDGYDTQTLAHHVHDWLGQLGMTRYFLAAHDVGAWVAYPYAALFGGEIQRLALLDAGIPGITLPDANVIGYSTLALGSAMALFLYPHSVTGVLASRSRDTIKRNMAALPAYSLVLGLLALLGYMAIAAGVKPIVSDGKLAAIVSIGDVVKRRIDSLQAERDQLEAYIQQ